MFSKVFRTRVPGVLLDPHELEAQLAVGHPRAVQRHRRRHRKDQLQGVEGEGGPTQHAAPTGLDGAVRQTPASCAQKQGMAGDGADRQCSYLRHTDPALGRGAPAWA